MGSIKRQKLLNFIWSLAFWKAHESNFRAEATFRFSLPAMQIKVDVTGWCRVQPFMVWKHEDNSPKHTHELWQEEFKMRSVTVEYPLNLIAQNRKKNDKKFRKSIAVEIQLVVAWSRLSTGNCYHKKLDSF